MAYVSTDIGLDFRKDIGFAMLNDNATVYTVEPTGFQADLGGRTIGGIGSSITADGGYLADGLLTHLSVFQSVDEATLFQNFAAVDISEFKDLIAAAQILGDFRDVYAALLSGDDQIIGDFYDENWIHGFSGDDIINGGRRDDRLFGGEDNDTLVGGRGSDRLNGGEGSDLAVYEDAGKSVKVTLGGDKWVDVLVGGKVEDRIRSVENILGSEKKDVILGDGGNNELSGYLGDDRLEGRGGADILNGNIGDDVLNGGKGLDTLNGGRGADTLIGGKGQDFLVFDTTLDAATNVDTVVGFKSGVDRFYLSKGDFGSLSGSGAIDAAWLAFGSAKDADDYLIYKKGQGKMFYDADGDGTTYDAILFARLGKNTALSADDIFLTT